MSTETTEWLNNFCLIGYTEKRGNAWHYRADSQGDEPNHYIGAIPQDDVLRRLFFFDLVEGDHKTTYTMPNGEVVTLQDASRKNIIRPKGTFGEDDPGNILGTFKAGFQIHPYREWLVDNLNLIMSQGLQIGSAGLLRGGAQAWVQLELPETITLHGNIQLRPHLLACTSVDGSLATTYMRSATNVVCDNTLGMATGEKTDAKVKIRHSRYSTLKVAQVRDALGVLEQTAGELETYLDRLTNTTVTDAQWEAFLQALCPTAEDASKAANTRAESKAGKLNELYRHDNRVAPWAGNAWGVVQAINTYEHHHAQINGSKHYADRNVQRALTGKWSEIDRNTLDILEPILA